MINEFILFEDLLTENIPADLIKAYKNAFKAAKGGTGDISQNSDHNEFANDTRRSFKWDYGKSNYEAMTADEAIEYLNLEHANVRTIAEKLPELRLIINGRLAEWENHNGKIYYLYSTNIPWEKLSSINSEGFKGKGYNTNDTKFAQTAKDIAICLKCADKIYKTDEYQHPLYNDPEKIKDREFKNKLSSRGEIRIYGRDAVLPPEYDPHMPFKNYKSTLRYIKRERDTGAHDVRKRYADAHFDPIIAAEVQKQEAKHKLISAKNAYNKLKKEKDEYDLDEFEQKEKRLKDKIDKYSFDYNEAIKEYNSLKGKYHELYNDKVNDFQTKIRNYLSKWEELSEKAFNLKTRLDQELNSIMDFSDETILDKLDYSLRYKITGLNKNIENTINKINSDLEAIKNLESEGEDLNNHTGLQTDIQTKLNDLNSYNLELNQLKETQINKHLDKINDLEAVLKDVLAELNTVRKREAEEKAKKASKNKKAELDPRIANLVKFRDDSAKTDAQSA